MPCYFSINIINGQMRKVRRKFEKKFTEKRKINFKANLRKNFIICEKLKGNLKQICKTIIEI